MNAFHADKIKINKELKNLKKGNSSKYFKDKIIQKIFQIDLEQESSNKNGFCWKQFMNEGYLESTDMSVARYFMWKWEKYRIVYTTGLVGYPGKEGYKIHLRD